MLESLTPNLIRSSGDLCILTVSYQIAYLTFADCFKPGKFRLLFMLVFFTLFPATQEPLEIKENIYDCL